MTNTEHAKSVLSHLREFGGNGFNTAQITKAINDAGPAETVRTLLMRLDAMREQVSAINRDIDLVVKCLSVLEISESSR